MSLLILCSKSHGQWALFLLLYLVYSMFIQWSFVPSLDSWKQSSVHPVEGEWWVAIDVVLGFCGACVRRFNASDVETKKPLHRECGFIRMQPGTNRVAFIVAQNSGTSWRSWCRQIGWHAIAQYTSTSHGRLTPIQRVLGLTHMCGDSFGKMHASDLGVGDMSERHITI